MVVALGMLTSGFVEYVFLVFGLAAVGNSGGSILPVLLPALAVSVAYIYVCVRLFRRHRHVMAVVASWSPIPIVVALPFLHELLFR